MFILSDFRYLIQINRPHTLTTTKAATAVCNTGSWEEIATESNKITVYNSCIKK